MSYTDAGTMDRRDAAVASALAGLVVVILGYASGLGLQTSNAASVPSVPGLTTAPPTASAPDSTDTPPEDPGHDSSAHGVTDTEQHAASAGHTQTPHSPTTDPHADPATPHVPAPTTPPTLEPAPTDPATTCQTGLLEGLPVVDSLARPVSSLLSPVVGSPTSQSGLLACTVGAVVGPACCSTTQATRTNSVR